jgi:protein STE50
MGPAAGTGSGSGSGSGLGGSGSGSGSARELPPPSAAGVSYAVAIYPYMAEQEDEFDVVVGDTFVILSRARGWWVVQRDPAGTGAVAPDTRAQGWVPAGCLLETNVPVASAIAEATGRAREDGDGEGGGAGEREGQGQGRGDGDGDGGERREERRTPIMPLSIVSTSFPGIALTDYTAKGEEELDLAKDDALRVFKRYNHWSYAVKEESGDRGWVPVSPFPFLSSFLCRPALRFEG